MNRSEKVDLRRESDTVESFLDKLLARVSLRTKYKAILREELKDYFENRTKAFTDIGYQSYAAETIAIRRFGSAEKMIDEINRIEAARSWTRDGFCMRVVFIAIILTAAFALLTKAAFLLAGLCGVPMSYVGGFDQTIGSISRLLVAFLSGMGAYLIYKRNGGNPYRIRPFIHLSLVLTILAFVLGLDVSVVDPFPAAKWHLFATCTVPSVSHVSTLVYDLDFSGIAANCNRPANLAFYRTPLEGHIWSASLMGICCVWAGAWAFLTYLKGVRFSRA